MTKIEKIAYKYSRGDSPTQQQFTLESVQNAMKEYAEFYANKCLEIVIEEYSYMLDRDCVLSLKLAEHE